MWKVYLYTVEDTNEMTAGGIRDRIPRKLLRQTTVADTMTTVAAGGRITLDTPAHTDGMKKKTAEGLFTQERLVRTEEELVTTGGPFTVHLLVRTMGNTTMLAGELLLHINLGLLRLTTVATIAVMTEVTTETTTVGTRKTVDCLALCMLVDLHTGQGHVPLLLKLTLLECELPLVLPITVEVPSMFHRIMRRITIKSQCSSAIKTTTITTVSRLWPLHTTNSIL